MNLISDHYYLFGVFKTSTTFTESAHGTLL